MSYKSVNDKKPKPLIIEIYDHEKIQYKFELGTLNENTLKIDDISGITGLITLINQLSVQKQQNPKQSQQTQAHPSKDKYDFSDSWDDNTDKKQINTNESYSKNVLTARKRNSVRLLHSESEKKSKTHEKNFLKIQEDLSLLQQEIYYQKNTHRLYDTHFRLVYEGKMKNGYRTGTGTEYFFYPFKKKEGKFYNGRINGFGKEYYQNSSLSKIGNFKFDRLQSTTGSNAVYSENGKLKYRGGFDEDRFNDKGIHYDEKGGILCIGSFKKSWFYDGRGYQQTSPSSTTFSSILINNNNARFIYMYWGDVKKGMKHGFGVEYCTHVQMNLPLMNANNNLNNQNPNNPDIMNDEFNNNYNNLNMTMFLNKKPAAFSNKNIRFIGRYILSKREGIGFCYEEEGGLEYSGNFSRGKRDGFGVKYYPNTMGANTNKKVAFYEGYWKENLPDGEGLIKNKYGVPILKDVFSRGFSRDGGINCINLYEDNL